MDAVMVEADTHRKRAMTALEYRARMIREKWDQNSPDLIWRSRGVQRWRSAVVRLLEK